MMVQVMPSAVCFDSGPRPKNNSPCPFEKMGGVSEFGSSLIPTAPRAVHAIPSGEVNRESGAEPTAVGPATTQSPLMRAILRPPVTPVTVPASLQVRPPSMEVRRLPFVRIPIHFPSARTMSTRPRPPSAVISLHALPSNPLAVRRKPDAALGSPVRNRCSGTPKTRTKPPGQKQTPPKPISIDRA